MIFAWFVPVPDVTIGGLLLLAVTPATINQLAAALTQHELSEDPHDFIAGHLLGYAHGLTGSAVTFAAVYLLLHGITKIVLVAALLRNQIWAYPWMIAFLLIFIGYQLYRIVLSPALGLSALTVFDGSGASRQPTTPSALEQSSEKEGTARECAGSRTERAVRLRNRHAHALRFLILYAATLEIWTLARVRGWSR